MDIYYHITRWILCLLLSRTSRNIIYTIITIYIHIVVGGYIFMALTVNKEGGFGDVSNNIPNRSLWCALPSLVVAGCMVTKETLMGLMGKGGEGEMSEPIADDTN